MKNKKKAWTIFSNLVHTFHPEDQNNGHRDVSMAQSMNIIYHLQLIGILFKFNEVFEACEAKFWITLSFKWLYCFVLNIFGLWVSWQYFFWTSSSLSEGCRSISGNVPQSLQDDFGKRPLCVLDDGLHLSNCHLISTMTLQTADTLYTNQTTQHVFLSTLFVSFISFGVFHSALFHFY